MVNKFKDIDDNKPASFKQSWAVGYHFAKLLKVSYPKFSERELANLIKGTIYYYHKKKGGSLTHGMVQQYLENKVSFPEFYSKHLNEYIDSNKIESEEEEKPLPARNILKPEKW